MKNIDIYDTTLRDGSQSEDVKWSMELDNIKVILYEYMAIIYNWLKGRI